MRQDPGGARELRKYRKIIKRNFQKYLDNQKYLWYANVVIKGGGIMNAMEGVKEIMELRQVTPAMLRDRIGIKKPNVLSQRFTQKNVSIGILNEMVKAMDYKVVLVPREARLPKDSFEIE